MSSAQSSLTKSTAALTSAASVLWPLLKRFAPPTFKYICMLLVLINIRSFPLAWHFRVFSPVFRIRFQHQLVKWKTMFSSKQKRAEAEAEWFDGLTPIGKNPFELEYNYGAWASPDDCDFNGHLSNSSYAKTLDSARFEVALAWYPQFFAAGGWLPLAGTHYNFIREIPMFAKYEVRSTVGAWDNKWIFSVSRFVTKTKPKTKHTKPEPSTPTTSSDEFSATLRTPASTDEVSLSPTPTADRAPSTPDEAIKALLKQAATQTEPDGATLHTIAISQICFKVGRITVPPVLVMAMNGQTCSPPPSSSSFSTYSPENPPPNWIASKKIGSRAVGGSPKKMHQFLKGGWKELPESERWWEAPMSGEVAERNKRNYPVLNMIKSGIEGTRALA